MFDFKQIKNAGLDLLYPALCPVCGQIVPWQAGRDIAVHKTCLKKLKVVSEPVCKKCGKPLLSAQAMYCHDCTVREKPFEYGYGLWQYNEISAASIFGYKYDKRREYVDFYAQALVYRYGKWIHSLQLDMIVPVPISCQKIKSRGFNQAGLLAEKLSKLLDIPCGEGLKRIHSTTPQKELDKRARQQNLRKAFYAEQAAFDGIKKVLLIDDIYTTGNTMTYCTQALKNAGVTQVWFLTLCIGGAF